MTVIDWLVLAAYAFLMLWIGFFYSHRNKDAEDYHLGGRSMNPILVGLSLFASIIDDKKMSGLISDFFGYNPLESNITTFPTL